MKQRVLFFLCVMTALAGFAMAQGKVVTNADLEKFKQKRVQAEKDLKEHYAKMGLSEEDIAKRDAADAKAREELSARLRANRLEQERLDRETRERETTVLQLNTSVPSYDYGYSGYYLYGNRLYRNPRVWNRPFNNGVTWRATPMGIIYEPGSLPASIWPPPQQQRTMPAWRNSRPQRP